MPSRPKRPAKHAEIVRAEPAAAHAGLDAEQRELLSEALRRGEELQDEVESKILAYGRWLLGAVFRDDAAAALDEKGDNPVWRELVRRADGPTLPVSNKMLYVALNVAAHDKRIGDQSWRRLDVARKELLLPLGEDAALREAAQHVSKFNLTQADTKAYVTEALKTQGRSRQVRLTAPRLVSRLKTLRTSLDKAAVLRKIADVGRELPDDAREEALAEVERLRAALGEVARALRGKR
jgi:hypothetical protein